MAIVGDYPIQRTTTNPVPWPSTPVPSGYVYSYPWTPSKAEFDKLKADVARILEIAEVILNDMRLDVPAKPTAPPEPLKADDI